MSERTEHYRVRCAATDEELAVELHVRACGSGGPTLLCLHGFGDNLHTWQRLREQLAPRGARFIAVDLPGLGSTPLPPGFARRYLLSSVELTREILLRVRAESSDRERVFVLGNSLGGAIALGLAAREDEHRGLVDGYVLLAPATPNTRLPMFAHLADSALYRWTGGVQRRLSPRARRALAIAIARASFHLVLAGGTRAPHAWRESIVASFTRPGALDDVERIARDVLWTLRGNSPEVDELWARLGQALTPMIVLHGDEDRVISRAEMERLESLSPAASLRRLAGVGHCPQIEAPERCVEALMELERRAEPRES